MHIIKVILEITKIYGLSELIFLAYFGRIHQNTAPMKPSIGFWWKKRIKMNICYICLCYSWEGWVEMWSIRNKK